MGNMEFISYNYINTTTVVNVSSGSADLAYLFDRSRTSQYETSGEADDTKTAILRVVFSSAKTISRIVLQNINLKGFKIYYNSNTANTITLTNALTTTSVWSANAETDLYLKFATITSVDSVFISATTTMAANQEKKVGELWIGDKYLTLTTNPEAKDYKTGKDPKQFVHTMSDGGTIIYSLAEKYKADIKLQYVSEADKNTLYDIWSSYYPFGFIPFQTGTSWDGKKIYEVTWIDDFDFDNYTYNDKNLGFSGMMKLRETPS